MNAQRRKRLGNILERLTALRDELEEIEQEERDYFDAMPESLQTSERGEAAENAAAKLEEARDQVDEAAEAIEEAAA